MNPTRRNILLITNIPTPYRIPLFNELNRQLQGVGLTLQVAFGALSYPRRRWKIDPTEFQFSYTVLKGSWVPLGDHESGRFTYPGIGSAIKTYDPGLIITGGFSVATMKLWLRSLAKPTPYLIWSGAIHRHGQPDPAWSRWQRRLLIKRSTGCIAYGTTARDYLIEHGAAPSRVTVAINTVDTSFYQRESAAIRSTLTSGTVPHFLYVGNLESGKRVDSLIAAAGILNKSNRPFLIDIVGDGSQRSSLQKDVVRLGLDSRFVFHGHQQKEDVVRYLAQAQAFLFPSDYDIWGLVVVEAMAAGLPCISSIRAGVTKDLVHDGITGFAVNFDDHALVASKMEWLMDHPTERSQMGQEAARIIANHATIPRSAAAFVEAIRAALKPLPPRGN